MPLINQSSKDFQITYILRQFDILSTNFYEILTVTIYIFLLKLIVFMIPLSYCRTILFYNLDFFLENISIKISSKKPLTIKILL